LNTFVSPASSSVLYTFKNPGNARLLVDALSLASPAVTVTANVSYIAGCILLARNLSYISL
jgi:hypothetical protein